jgi:excisionase family DNA binding protein
MAVHGAVGHDNRPMLTYPAGFTALDCRRIDLALQEAVAVLRHTAGSDWDAAAVQAVRQVLNVVAVTLERHRDRQRVADLVAAADDLRDQVIAEIDCVRTTIQTKVDAFEAIVLADLEQDAWWGDQLGTMRVARAAASPPDVPASDPRSTDSRSLLTMKQVAKRLQLSEDTLTRMEASGELKVVVLGPKSKRVHPAELDRLLKQPKYQYRR